MPSCKFIVLQKDGFHGNCGHPEAQPGGACILNTEDECQIREPEMTTIMITMDDKERLRKIDWPLHKAVKKLLDANALSL